MSTLIGQLVPAINLLGNINKSIITIKLVREFILSLLKSRYYYAYIPIKVYTSYKIEHQMFDFPYFYVFYLILLCIFVERIKYYE